MGNEVEFMVGYEMVRATEPVVACAFGKCASHCGETHPLETPFGANNP